MDAIALLKADHKKVNALFKELSNLGDTAHARRKKLFVDIDREPTLHAHVEENIFYPAFKTETKANSDERDQLLEHHVKEEEDEMFKQAKKLLSKAELETLGKKMQAAKLRAKS